MNYLLKSKIGRLRIIGFLEGLSFLALVFVAVPLKYYDNNPYLTEIIGPIHGALFLLFIMNTFSVGYELNWKFKTITWKIILAVFIPFGTFYIDKTILSKLKVTD